MQIQLPIQKRPSIFEGFLPLQERLLIPIFRIKGGCSNVYIVKDQISNEHYALKTPRLDKLNGAMLVSREIEVLKKISGNGFAKMIAYDYSPPSILFEYLGNDCLFIKKPTVLESINIYAEAALLLSSFHDKGILHRDIKPSNIFYQDSIKFVDFAFAKIDGVDEFPKNKALGTLEFMAPEMLRKTNDDPRSDIYSLGMSLYFSLSRSYAIDSTNKKDYIKFLQNNESAIPIILRNSNIPVILNNIIMKAIEKDPKSRYQSAEIFAQELKKLNIV